MKEESSGERRWQLEAVQGDTELSPSWPVQQACQSYLLNLPQATSLVTPAHAMGPSWPSFTCSPRDLLQHLSNHITF